MTPRRAETKDVDRWFRRGWNVMLLRAGGPRPIDMTAAKLFAIVHTGDSGGTIVIDDPEMRGGFAVAVGGKWLKGKKLASRLRTLGLA